MATVTFYNLPAHGHINPTLPLVAELSGRGEQVIYYATDAFRHKIEKTGATFRGYGDKYAFDPTANLGGPFGLMARSIEVTEAMLPALLEQARADRPDYLLVDSICVWGNYMRQLIGCPAVSVCSTFGVNSKVMSALSRSRGPKPPLRETLVGIPLVARYFAVARRIDRRFGTRRPGFTGFFTNRQALNLVFTSPGFQAHVDSFDSSYRFVGPAITERHETVDFPLDALGPEPIIYISLGTIFNDVASFYRACFAAFADSGRTVVMSIGRNVDERALGTPPPNFLVRRYVPQLEILRRAALFVTHGGMNSVNEALLYGVPMIVVPQVGDQYLVGNRVRELGAGLTVPRSDATPARLRELAVRVLAEPLFRQRCQEIGASLREAGGHSRAADEIWEWKREHGIA